MRLTYEQDVRGRSVVDAAGRVIGEVDQLYLDSESLKIAGLRVKLRSEAADAIGAQHGLFRSALLEVPAEAIQSLGGDTIVLRTDALALTPREPSGPRGG